MFMRLFKSAAVAGLISALSLGGLLMLRIILMILSLASPAGSGGDGFAVSITGFEKKLAVGIAVVVFLYFWRQYWVRLGKDPDMPIS